MIINLKVRVSSVYNYVRRKRVVSFGRHSSKFSVSSSLLPSVDILIHILLNKIGSWTESGLEQVL